MNENQKSQKDTARAEVSLWSIVGLLLRKIHWLIAAGLAFGIQFWRCIAVRVNRQERLTGGRKPCNDLFKNIGEQFCLKCGAE